MDKNNFNIRQYKTLINHKEKILKLFLLPAILIMASCTSPNPISSGGSESPFAVYVNADASGKRNAPLVFNDTIIDEINIENIDIRHIYIKNESEQDIDSFTYELPFGFHDEETFDAPQIDSDVISCTKKVYLDPQEICRVSIRFQPNARDGFMGKIKLTVPKSNYSVESIKLMGNGLNNTSIDINDRKKLQLGFIEHTETINKTITLVHNQQTLERIGFKLIFDTAKVENNGILNITYLPNEADTNSCILTLPSIENDEEYGQVLEGTLEQGATCTLSFKITNNGELDKFAYSTIIIKQDSFKDIIPVTGIVVKENKMSTYSPPTPLRRSSHMLSIHDNKLLLRGGAYRTEPGTDLQLLNDIWKYSGFGWDNVTASYTSVDTIRPISNAGSAFIDNTTFLIGGIYDGEDITNTVTTLDKEKKIVNNIIGIDAFPEKHSFAHALLDKYVYILGGIGRSPTDHNIVQLDNDTLRRLDTSSNPADPVEITMEGSINRALMMASLNGKLYILSNNDPSNSSNLMSFHVIDNLTSEKYRDVTAGDNISFIFMGFDKSVLAPSRIKELHFTVRDNASIATANNSIFVFGGKTSTGATNDMFLYAESDHEPIPIIINDNITPSLTKCCAFTREDNCSNTCKPESPKAFAWAQFDNKTTPIPEPRYNAQMQTIGDDIYLFGGIGADNETRFNDLWKYETKNYQWVKLMDNSDIGNAINQTPPVLTDDNKICTLNNSTTTGTYDDGDRNTANGLLYCYDISTNMFKFIHPEVNLPEDVKVSKGAKTIYYNNSIYLFQKSNTGKINVYNFDNNSWYVRALSPDISGDTSLDDGMSLTVDNNIVYSFESPYDNKKYTYTYDLKGIKEIKKSKFSSVSAPTPRKNGAMTIFKNYIYLQGGNNEDIKLNDTWRLDINTPQDGWKNLSDNIYMPRIVPPYTNHSLVELEDELYLIGVDTADTHQIYKFNENPQTSGIHEIIGWEEVVGLTISVKLHGDNRFIKLDKNTVITIHDNTLKVLQINKNK